MSTISEIGRMALILALLIGIFLVARRILLFLRNLMRPVLGPARAAVRPQEDALLGHVDRSLRSAGLDGTANVTGSAVQAVRGLDEAVGKHLDNLERDIQAKREREDPNL